MTTRRPRPEMAVPEINTPDFLADLHAHYARLRAAEPVHYHEFEGSPRWSLLRYDDVAAAFCDPRLTPVRLPEDVVHNVRHSGHRDLENLGRVIASILIIKDGPDHTRLRKLVSRAFTPRMVERLTGRVEALVGELLDPFHGRPSMEWIRDFAVPLPVIVIGELLGVPTDDRECLKRWSADFAPLLDRTLNVQGLLPAAAACTGFAGLFEPLFEARRREPRDDLVSALVAVADEGDGALDPDELLATCLLLLVAGHETTTNLLANGLLTLLRHPDELAWLRRHPEAMGTAVEELLRYEGPLMRVVRHAREDVEVRGVTIPAGRIVDLVMASANRDPERFAEPGRLDLQRPDNRHLSFGLGAHFCLGAALARLEARIALRALLERFPAVKLVSDAVEWRPGTLFRGLRTLPLSL
ncbi:MAG: cytochrome P450 [Myxococcota bacterium]|nr:cytochrome P450 [Myxococcota bacterium]